MALEAGLDTRWLERQRRGEREREASEAILTYFSSFFALDNLEIGLCKETILVS